MKLVSLLQALNYYTISSFSGERMSEVLAPVVRMVGHTRTSLHLTWTSGRPTEHPPQQTFYLLQIYDKIDGWIPKYWGLKNETILTNLAPEEVYTLRVGAASTSNDEYVWSQPFKTATQIDSSRLYNLFRAVERNNLNELKEFLTERPRLVDAMDNNGSSALIRGVRAGNNAAVKALLGAGADVNLRCEGSLRSALMTACYHGNVDAARMLIVAGADVHQRDRIKCTALHYAVDGGHLDAIQNCLQFGADINVQDDSGWTPLMRALVLGAKREVLNILTAAEPDPTIKDRHQRTIEDLAILTNNKEIMKWLNTSHPDRHLKTK